MKSSKFSSLLGCRQTRFVPVTKRFVDLNVPKREHWYNDIQSNVSHCTVRFASEMAYVVTQMNEGIRCGIKCGNMISVEIWKAVD